ncbi:hypothetical protein BC830DRAFT_1175912 [Chytriomyces sp. MP71]|nr:hypothetical protein BC830DRAFT_1175912 [Chytriomyces sp. MP71]
MRVLRPIWEPIRLHWIHYRTRKELENARLDKHRLREQLVLANQWSSGIDVLPGEILDVIASYLTLREMLRLAHAVPYFKRYGKVLCDAYLANGAKVAPNRAWTTVAFQWKDGNVTYSLHAYSTLIKWAYRCGGSMEIGVVDASVSANMGRNAVPLTTAREIIPPSMPVSVTFHGHAE